MYRIKWLFSFASLVLCMALRITAMGWAQEGEQPEMVPAGKVTTGKLEYRSHCAQCRGPKRKGRRPCRRRTHEETRRFDADYQGPRRNVSGGVGPAVHRRQRYDCRAWDQRDAHLGVGVCQGRPY
jgi:hypothetical protein